jgi:hypothetical protein
MITSVAPGSSPGLSKDSITAIHADPFWVAPGDRVVDAAALQEGAADAESGALDASLTGIVEGVVADAAGIAAAQVLVERIRVRPPSAG